MVCEVRCNKAVPGHRTPRRWANTGLAGSGSALPTAGRRPYRQEASSLTISMGVKREGLPNVEATR